MLKIYLENYFSSVLHQFEVKNYFLPTNCDHCRHLLPGLTRQGLQCRHCSFNVHERCRDLCARNCIRREVAAVAATFESYVGGASNLTQSAQSPSRPNPLVAEALQRSNCKTSIFHPINIILLLTPPPINWTTDINWGSWKRTNGVEEELEEHH